MGDILHGFLHWSEGMFQFSTSLLIPYSWKVRYVLVQSGYRRHLSGPQCPDLLFISFGNWRSVPKELPSNPQACILPSLVAVTNTSLLSCHGIVLFQLSESCTGATFSRRPSSQVMVVAPIPSKKECSMESVQLKR